MSLKTWDEWLDCHKANSCVPEPYSSAIPQAASGTSSGCYCHPAVIVHLDVTVPKSIPRLQTPHATHPCASQHGKGNAMAETQCKLASKKLNGKNVYLTSH